MATEQESTAQSDTHTRCASIAELRGAVGRIEGTVNALVEGQRQLIDGQRQINQRIDRVNFAGGVAAATLASAIVGGLVAVATLA